MTTRTLTSLITAWRQARHRRRDDRGSYSTETAVVTTLLVGGAIIILGVIVAFGTDLANSLEFGPVGP